MTEKNRTQDQFDAIFNNLLDGDAMFTFSMIKQIFEHQALFEALIAATPEDERGAWVRCGRCLPGPRHSEKSPKESQQVTPRFTAIRPQAKKATRATLKAKNVRKSREATKPRTEKVMAFISENDGVNSADIRAVFGLDNPCVTKLLHHQNRRGMLCRKSITKIGKDGPRFKYSTTPLYDEVYGGVQ